MLRRIQSLAIAALLAACGDSSPSSSNQPIGGEDDKIAPNCAEAWCAEVEIDAKLSCTDPIWETSHPLEARISGRTHEVSCSGAEGAAGGLDLAVGISPNERAEGDASDVWFVIRNYTGPGTYDLFNVDEEGDHIGLKIVGNVAGSEAKREQIVGTNACQPAPGCTAIVAEPSELIPNDPMSTHEFRVRAKIECPAGARLTDMHCDSAAAVVCTFDEAPMFEFEVACRN